MKWIPGTIVADVIKDDVVNEKMKEHLLIQQGWGQFRLLLFSLKYEADLGLWAKMTWIKNATTLLNISCPTPKAQKNLIIDDRKIFSFLLFNAQKILFHTKYDDDCDVLRWRGICQASSRSVPTSEKGKRKPNFDLRHLIVTNLFIRWLQLSLQYLVVVTASRGYYRSISTRPPGSLVHQKYVRLRMEGHTRKQN